MSKEEKNNANYLKEKFEEEILKKPFNSNESKTQFDKGMERLNVKYKDYFEKCPEDVFCVENFVLISQHGFSFKDENYLSDEIRLDILSLLKGLPS
ncbi:hypothetical protein R3X25_11760 [Lutibacter sp. TH_r2]|uniref:hypothetical protein n=1 Tax=Lutibacter sp. TH_r2 TaxID=3082083 RepID=UPI002952AA69|nr:hypothetical protein [Lutibacter sp. TH_r2]MDV7187959.1 hypothetical protein [Lutibacter sp. TH_r2]